MSNAKVKQTPDPRLQAWENLFRKARLIQLPEWVCVAIPALIAMVRERDVEIDRMVDHRFERARKYSEMADRALHAEAIVAAAYEAAARFIDTNEISHTSQGDVMQPRKEGNRYAIAYATAIRTLTPADARAQLDAMLMSARNEGIEAAKQAMLASAAGLCLGALQTVDIADAADALKQKD